MDTTHEYANTAPQAIPDTQRTAAAKSTITMPDKFFVADLDAGLWISHAYAGTIVRLIQDPYSGADNINELLYDNSFDTPGAHKP